MPASGSSSGLERSGGGIFPTAREWGLEFHGRCPPLAVRSLRVEPMLEPVPALAERGEIVEPIRSAVFGLDDVMRLKALRATASNAGVAVSCSCPCSLLLPAFRV
jgi:hypothetical protein